MDKNHRKSCDKKLSFGTGLSIFWKPLKHISDICKVTVKLYATEH